MDETDGEMNPGRSDEGKGMYGRRQNEPQATNGLERLEYDKPWAARWQYGGVTMTFDIREGIIDVSYVADTSTLSEVWSDNEREMASRFVEAARDAGDSFLYRRVLGSEVAQAFMNITGILYDAYIELGAPQLMFRFVQHPPAPPCRMVDD